MFNCTIILISHISKIMLKILQARLQQYVNCEISDVQAGFIKGWGNRHQIAIIRWIIKKAREFQKNIYFCFIDYAKAFDCVDHNKLWVWSEVLVAQSCLTLCDPRNCNPPDFSVHGILLARILWWITIPFSRRSSRPRDQTRVSCIASRFFTVWAENVTKVYCW